jgi:molybdate transport system ATP-binding protein
LNLMTGTFTGSGIETAEGWAVAGHVEDLELDGRQLDPLPLDGQSRAQGKAAAVAVFPPSAVSVFLNDAHGSPRNSFEVAITDLEPHGDFIRVRAGSLAADITPAASADLGLVPGLTVHFVVKATSVAVYPA